jgi:alditol oxidase
VKQNWARNITFSAASFLEPTSLDELSAIVVSQAAQGISWRVLGCGHSFNTIADTNGALISLAKLPVRIDIDTDANTVTASAGLRYGDLATALHAKGFALHNLASLPHITLAGAVATGTHGSGDANGSLATAVTAIDCMRPDGTVEIIRRGHDDTFAGSVVSLGMLGIVTALTFAIEPTFAVSQTVFENVPMPFVAEHLDQVFASGCSVSVFTTWQQDVAQVWVKRRSDDTYTDVLDDHYAATGSRHPLPGVDGSACTEQSGMPGPWHERLPHFRIDVESPFGDELQTEFFVDRRHSADVLRIVHELRNELAPVIMICELRSVAADDLWLSMAYGRHSLAVHFTWKPDTEAVNEVVAILEEALAPFDARPHWGKVFTTPMADVMQRYPHGVAFAELVKRYA